MLLKITSKQKTWESLQANESTLGDQGIIIVGKELSVCGYPRQLAHCLPLLSYV